MFNRNLLSMLLLGAVLLSSCEKDDDFYANKGNAGTKPKQAQEAISAYVNEGYYWSLPNGYAHFAPDGKMIFSFSGNGSELTLYLGSYNGSGKYQITGGENKIVYKSGGVPYSDQWGDVEITQPDDMGSNKHYISGKFSWKLASDFNKLPMTFEGGLFNVQTY